MLALAAVHVFLLTWRLESRTLHVDEILTCYRVKGEGRIYDAMHPFTYYLYVRKWCEIFGTSDAALRLSNLPPAIMAVACVGVLSWWLLPWPGSAMTFALLCLSSQLVLYWRMARYFACSAACFSLTMLAAVGYLRSQKRGWLLVGAAATIMSGYADYLPTVSTLLPWSFVIYAAAKRSRREVVAVFVILLIVLASLVPPILWAVEGAGKVTGEFQLFGGLRNFVLRAGLLGWSVLASEVVPPWQTIVALPMILGSGALILAGAREAWKKSVEWRLVLLAWPFAATIAWMAISATPEEPAARTSSLALHGLPFVYLCMALGWSALRARPWTGLAVAVVLAGHGVGLVNYFTGRNHLNPQYALDWRVVTRFLAQHMQHGDALLTILDAGAHRYLPVNCLREEAITLRRGGMERLKNVLRRGNAVWVILRDRGGRAAIELNRKVRQELIASGAAVTEIHYFFPYTGVERAWRRMFGMARGTPAYVTVFKLQQRRRPHSPAPAQESATQ